MKISTYKTATLHLLRNPVQCSLQFGEELLQQMEKFMFLGVAFTSDGSETKNWKFDEAKQVLLCEL